MDAFQCAYEFNVLTTMEHPYVIHSCLCKLPNMGVSYFQILKNNYPSTTSDAITQIVNALQLNAIATPLNNDLSALRTYGITQIASLRHITNVNKIEHLHGQGSQS